MDGSGTFDAIGLAARQWSEYRRVTPGRWFAEGHRPLARDEAYAVQSEVARLRVAAGDSVAGWKVGCIGPGVVEQFGMTGPIRARLFTSELHASGATLRHAAYANLAIEGEMAVRVGADGGIAASFPVIELHHFVFRGSPKTLGELIANNGLNAGVVLPDETKSASIDESADHRLAVRIDGRDVDVGSLWAMPGGAAESVRWLRDDLARHGLVLGAGDLVLTGTPLALHPVRVGQHVGISIDDDVRVECRVV